MSKQFDNEHLSIEDYIRYLETNFEKLSESEIKYHRDNVVTRICKKNDFLLKEGQMASEGFFILNGCVRRFVLVDGREITIEFFGRHSWCTPWSSFVFNEPSQYSDQCIEPTTVVVFTPQNDEDVTYDNPKYARMALTQLRKHVADKEKVITSLLINDAKSRYLDFENRYPFLMHRLPLKQLATYLNMRPETLSRIRKELARGK